MNFKTLSVIAAMTALAWLAAADNAMAEWPLA